MRVVVAGLVHAYRRRPVLDGVDAEFGPGVVGLLGPNGAGKTTLLRLLAGVLRPRTGRARASGRAAGGGAHGVHDPRADRITADDHAARAGGTAPGFLDLRAGRITADGHGAGGAAPGVHDPRAVRSRPDGHGAGGAPPGAHEPRAVRLTAGAHDLRTRAGRRALRRELGYLPQDAALPPDMSPREFLDYAGLLKGMAESRERREQAADLVERLGLDAEADRPLGALSAGARRRVGIAQALMGRPRLVLLDEPTADLDVEERVRLRTVLGTLGPGRTVVLCTHLLEDVQAVCAEVAVLHRGRTAFSGPTAELTAIAADRTFALARPPHEGGPDGASAPLPGERVIAEEPPPGARPVPPTLEEGYAALMRDLREDPTTD